MKPDNQISIPDKIVAATNAISENPGAEIRDRLISLINELINSDFHALVQLLYRIDVDEKRIRLYLNQKTGEDSASVIADLIIERQLQKMAIRKKFGGKNHQQNEEEKW